MIAWLCRRVAAGALLVAAVAIGTAAVVQLVPGDARDVLATGLRRPAAEAPPSPAASPWIWLGGAARGDLGRSIRHHEPVARLILERVPRTLALTLSGVAIQLALGIGIGVLLARRRGGWDDALATLGLYVLDAVPAFWLGIVLMLVFAVLLGWLPVGGLTADPFAERSAWERLADHARHLVLPALTLGLAGAATIARFLRTSLLEALDTAYVLTARAGGLPERHVVMKSALRNSLLPIITLFGLAFPGLLGGAVIVEKIFSWQGVGQLAADAVVQRDVPVVMGTNLVFALLVVAGSLVADLLYAAADPRIRIGARR